MDRFTALRVFRQVVELGSFAAAARQLSLSPAAISKNITELETHLGVRLLNRTTRSLSRTEAGERYYETVVRILDELDEVDATFGSHQDTPSGLLRVTVPMTLTLIRLSEAIPRFLQRYPKITLDLHMDSRRVDVVEEGFDIAIRSIDKLEDSSLIARKLITMQQVVCGSPDYFTAHGTPRHPTDLKDHNCLKFTLSGHVDDWEFEKEGAKVRLSVAGRYRATSSLAIRDALRAGFGLSLLPSIYVREDIESGRLRAVLEDWVGIKSTVYAVYPSRRFLPGKVRAFLDFVVEELGG